MSASLQPHGLYSPWNSPGQKTGMGSLSLLQGIFPTQGSNPGLPHCRQILYQLSHREAQEYGVGSLSLLQRIFLTQKSNRGHLHCRWILYQLSYQENAIIYTHTHTRKQPLSLESSPLSHHTFGHHRAPVRAPCVF